jgi:hypothetical protein
MSAGADLLGRGLALRFDRDALINVPGYAPPDIDLVGEGAAIPVAGFLPGTGATLKAGKLAVILEATSELLRDPNAEELLRKLLIDATAPALDRAMLSAAIGGPDRPPGLLNGVTQLPSSGSLSDDLVALIAAVAPVAGNGQIVLIAAPDVGAAISFLPRVLRPVLVSTALAPGTIIASPRPRWPPRPGPRRSRGLDRRHHPRERARRPHCQYRRGRHGEAGALVFPERRCRPAAALVHRLGPALARRRRLDGAAMSDEAERRAVIQKAFGLIARHDASDRADDLVVVAALDARLDELVQGMGEASGWPVAAANRIPGLP